jgi:hypothetical protein
VKRVLRCLGFLALGIGCVALGIVVVLTAVGALFWASFATATWFDVPQYYIVFVAGYFILVAGGTIGVILCRDDRT